MATATVAAPALSINSEVEVMIESLTQSGVVFFLGAGANLCDRLPGVGWTKGTDLPSGQELADYLAADFDYPGSRPPSLSLVTQYQIAIDKLGLDQKLRDIFLQCYHPTSLHTFLAELPGKLRAKGLPKFDGPVQSRMIFMTTNYDDLLEEAFRRKKEPVHVFTYVFRENRGRFWHRDATNNTNEVCIENPVNFAFDPNDHHSAIIKLHGAAHPDQNLQTFVIAEDQYSEYLIANANMSLMPPALGKQFPHSRFVFLGYSLSDWTMRANIHWIRSRQVGTTQSFAVQLCPDPLDVELWRQRGVRVIPTTLLKFIDVFGKKLSSRLM